MKANSKSLTKEINKIIPNSYNAFETINDCIGTFVNTNDSNTKSFLAVIKLVETKLANNPYTNDILISYREDAFGNAIPKYGFHVHTWNDNQDKMDAYKVKLALQMEDLLYVQKLALNKKEQLSTTIEAITQLNEIKKEVA